MYEPIVFKEFFSIAWRVFFHRVGVLYHFFDLIGCLFFLADSVSEGCLIVERDLLLLFRHLLRGGVVGKPSKVGEEGRRHHTSRSYSMGSVHHAPSNSLLLGVVGLFFIRFCNFYHVLKVEEATEGICMCLSLHHGQGLFVMSSLSVDRTRSDMYLLRFVIFHVMLILHVLVLLEVFVVFVVKVLWLLRWGRRRPCLLTSIKVVRLNLEVFLLVVWTIQLTARC
jgi:hypothetical protein